MASDGPFRQNAVSEPLFAQGSYKLSRGSMPFEIMGFRYCAAFTSIGNVQISACSRAIVAFCLRAPERPFQTDTTMALLHSETCAGQQPLFTVLIKAALVKRPILTHAVDMHLDCAILSSEESSNCILSERTVSVRPYYPTSAFDLTDSLVAEWD